jgi:hypothetical protein
MAGKKEVQRAMRAQDYAGELPDAAFRRSQAFRRQRFEALVQYVCWICEDPRALGLDRLNRILWYVDRNLYLTRDHVATGASYVRHRGGPWARPLEAVLRDLERRGLVVQRARVGDHEPDLLVSLARPDLSGFDPEEISLVEAVTRALCFDNRSTIAFREAHDVVLHAARLGEVIPYFTVFAGRAGDVAPADFTWAIRESERRPGQRRGAADEPMSGRVELAAQALVWHILRDPSLGASLPRGGAGPWFVYRQHGVAGSGVPDLAAVYRLDADELVLGGIRVVTDDQDESEDDEASSS